MKVRQPSIGAALGLTVLLVGALSACTSSQADTPSPVPTVTITTTATPPPAVTSPDDPVDALAAWHACAVLGEQEYLAKTSGAKLVPYDPAKAPTKNADGTFQAIVAFTPPPGPHDGYAGIVAICTIGGTLGSPTLVHFTMKDV